MSKIALNSNASGTGVFTIASPNSDTDRTLTLPDASGTVVSENASGDVAVTGDITSNGNAVITTQSPQLGRRNLIINGAMQVWQRGTSSTSSALDYHTVDRFWNYLSSGGTVQRSTDVPSGEGFAYSFRLTSNGYWAMGQPIELPVTGKTILRDNSDYTLSFWAKASASETIAVSVRYRDQKGSGTNTVAIASNTPTIGTSWARYSLTFNTGTIAPAGTNQIIDIEIADGAAIDIYLTGLQFEQSSVATPFEHRSYGEELALCQRYFQWLINEEWPDGKYNSDQLITSIYNSTRAFTKVFLKTVMRSSPTITGSNVSGTLYSANANDAITGLSNIYPDVSGVGLDFGGSSFPSGNAGHADLDSSTRIQADAEL